MPRFTPGELSVTFTRTGLARFAIYRMSSTPLGVQTLGVAGLIMLILGLGWTLSRRRGRRPSLGPAQ